MKLLFIALTSFFTSNLAHFDSHLTAKEEHPLMGVWKVDLRPTPDSEPYFQMFTISKVKGKSFEGTFYGSEIQDALINDSWEQIHFAFRSYDESNTYYHSGYLKDGKLYGMTYCPDRGFAAPWTADPKG